MSIMRLGKRRGLFLGFLAALILVGFYWVYDRGRPAPVPLKREIREGITYRRIVRYTPRIMIAHVLVIDRRTSGLRLFVTPPDFNEGAPLAARTTTEFMQDYGVQIAINGDGFSPWWSNSPVDYYPHSGDPVTPNGYAASEGEIYSRGPESGPPSPIIFISRRGEISFNQVPGRVFHAISGDRMLVLKGEPSSDLAGTDPEPRTAIGINSNGRWLYLVVVDGRQPFYSEGATLAELADLMINLGAEYALNLDGGGSSTMALEGEDGLPGLLNSPIDNYIPGRERPVANHLGIYLDD